MTLEFENTSTTKFSILSTAGQIIKTGKTNNVKHTINLEDLPVGIYFINIETHESKGTLRFMKE